jgi:hypothetical protein
LSALALVGAAVRYGLAPGAGGGGAPGEVYLAPVDTPPRGGLA